MRSLSVLRSSNGFITEAISPSDSIVYTDVASGVSKEVQVPDSANVVILTVVSGTPDVYLRIGGEAINGVPVRDVITDIVVNPYARIVTGNDKLHLFAESDCTVCIEFYK